MTTKTMVTVDFPWPPPHNYAQIVNSTAAEFGAAVGSVKWGVSGCTINASFQENEMAKLALLANQFQQKVRERLLAAIRDPSVATKEPKDFTLDSQMVLNEVASRQFSGEGAWLGCRGSALRVKWSNVSEAKFSAVLDELVGRYLECQGVRPDDTYYVTLEGIIQTRLGERVSRLLESGIAFFKRELRRDPHQDHFDWLPFRDSIQATDKDFGFADAAFYVVGWTPGGRGPESERQGRGWAHPPDLERIARCKDFSDYLDELRKEPRKMSTPASSGIATARKGTHKVFIVHGQDEEAKLAVKDLLQKLDLEGIVLHEQPNKGRTIIEKFEAHGDVDFALVLLTPDDIGGPAGTSLDKLKPRARQNVVLELGYFFGHLGRDRVCALLKHDVEIPSDFGGMLWVKMDPAGAWKMEVAREMKEQEIPVDLNRLV